eukprot:4343646-Pyramimonas_sp.AAC.1
MQWDAHYADVHAPEDGPLGTPMPIATRAFTMGEPTAALKNLAIGKAAGHDGIAPEFWKLLRMSSTACNHLLDICHRCWGCKNMPGARRLATVVLSFKKGAQLCLRIAGQSFFYLWDAKLRPR